MRIREKWRQSWTFVKKLQFFLIVIILAVTLTAIVVSVYSSVSFLSKQNEQYVSEQLSAMASEYESILEQYKAVAFSLVMDKHIQRYSSFSQSDMTMNDEVGNVYSTLLNVLYMQSNANFMAVTNREMGTYIYNGDLSIMDSRFEEVWEKDYQQSIAGKEKGALRLSFANQYYGGRKYTLTLYFPIYSVTRMNKENGMVIINLEDSLLEHLSNRTRGDMYDLYLTDINGVVVSGANREQMGKIRSFSGQLSGSSGNFRYGSQLVNYQRVGDWNYYLVNEVPISYLYRSSGSIVVPIICVMLLVIAISLLASGRMAMTLYYPINKLLSKMGDVSSGNLRTRIQTKDMDRDGRKLAEGFNTMMDEIDVLIKQVAEEQRQIAQMRFDGLQSQIQPHFLYNTLECIHWQAIADGNQEISTMVKAMAHYYRICLSEGKDIISLEKELEHVKNYLIIQNMRYGNIVDLEIHVSDEYQTLPIPKITLQPLVENALYHGIRVKEGRRGKILISAKEEEGFLYLTVEDDGKGMDQKQVDYINCHIADFDQNVGYGISNVNKRIELLYGQPCGLHYSLNENKGVKAVICLKAEGSGEYVSDSDRG